MEFQRAIWRKSSYSNANGGACVEVAALGDGSRAVRDSKNNTGPAIRFGAGEWAAFTAAVRNGEFI